ncbi:MAG: hypothetical protein ACE5IW_09875 [bacterium]
MSKIENYKNLICILTISLVILSCGESETPHVSVLPLIEGAELHFRGFVTDEEEELVSEIHNFSRKVIRKDTLDGHPVHAYVYYNQQIYFYTDENGTVWQYNTEDIGSRIVAYGLSFRAPILVSYWQILLKVDEGVGTEWSVSVDTTFDAINLAGNTERIHYMHDGKARYAGWTKTYIPERHNYVRVADAHWYELNTYIINETTGDTLFSSHGTAHQYFEPKLGAIKYITDFTKAEIGQSAVPLRGTWELMRKNIPE